VTRTVLAPILLVVVLLMSASTPSSAPAELVSFPPTQAGWPGAYHDETDIAPYLAFHKARAVSRINASRTVPTSNQNAYDVHFYALDLTLDPSDSTITGSVRIDARVLSGPLVVMELDLYDNMEVDAVEAGGMATTFSRIGDILTVVLNRPYVASEEVEVIVDYHGTPEGDIYFRYFNFDTVLGDPMIWSLSEPFGARSWWPCKDYPSDKADSVDVRVTTPSGLITASNGLRSSIFDNGTVAITEWQERYPISTYLVFVSSYPYFTFSDWYVHGPTDSMEIQFYGFTDSTSLSPHTSKVRTMMGAFADIFGEYPFINEKYGQAAFNSGGGMEHQTCSNLSDFANEALISHELAHQWWGDAITCSSFNHIWLNEGFATYAEALWFEAKSGYAAYKADLDNNKVFTGGTIYVSDESNVDRVFLPTLSYNKPSWVLHMLRHIMGDNNFFAALVEYRQNHDFSTATTEDFQAACEVVSGLDLDRFFQQWIYGERYPRYKYGWLSRSTPSGYELSVEIEQVQTWQLFTMPIDIRVVTSSGTQTFVVQDSLARQVFQFNLTEAPLSVSLDPDEWILRTVVFDQSGVEDSAAPAPLQLSVSANPTSGPVRMSLSLPVDGEVEFAVFDVMGGLITHELQSCTAGPVDFTWDIKDLSGSSVPAGVFWVVVQTPIGRTSKRLVVVR